MGKKLLLVLLITTTLLGGCSLGKNHKKIFDDKEKIVTTGDSYTYSVCKNYIKDTNGEIEFKGFSGSDTIWQMDGSGELSVEITGENESGDFKIAIVRLDDVILKEMILDGTVDEEFKLQLEEGKYAFKLVGRDCKGNFNIKIDTTGNLTINSDSN